MAVLKNRTQKNFTIISNSILRDKELSMKDRGVLCTICSLPDGWEFSIAGLSAIVPDGTDSIRGSIIKLEKLGYLVRTKTRTSSGKFASEIEVFPERSAVANPPSRKTRHGKSVTDNPSRIDRHGLSVTEKPPEYNTEDYKKICNTDHFKSINPSGDDGSTETKEYRALIANNIKLSWLLDTAGKHDQSEVDMVHEIYEVICDMVCFPRNHVKIKDTLYPWHVVKNRFLAVRYDHVASILNRVVDANLGIKKMSSYLVSTLYTASLVGELETQASLHDDYLKSLRGSPYAI